MFVKKFILFVLFGYLTNYSEAALGATVEEVRANIKNLKKIIAIQQKQIEDIFHQMARYKEEIAAKNAEVKTTLDKKIIELLPKNTQIATLAKVDPPTEEEAIGEKSLFNTIDLYLNDEKTGVLPSLTEKISVITPGVDSATTTANATFEREATTTISVNESTNKVNAIYNDADLANNKAIQSYNSAVSTRNHNGDILTQIKGLEPGINARVAWINDVDKRANSINSVVPITKNAAQMIEDEAISLKSCKITFGMGLHYEAEPSWKIERGIFNDNNTFYYTISYWPREGHRFFLMTNCN